MNGVSFFNFDKDGYEDILAITRGANSVVGIFSGKLITQKSQIDNYLDFSDYDIKIFAFQTPTNSLSTYSMCYGDLDGDNILDYAISHTYDSTYASRSGVIYLINGQDAQDYKTLNSTPNMSITDPTVYSQRIYGTLATTYGTFGISTACRNFDSDPAMELLIGDIYYDSFRGRMYFIDDGLIDISVGGSDLITNDANDYSLRVNGSATNSFMIYEYFEFCTFNFAL